MIQDTRRITSDSLKGDSLGKVGSWGMDLKAFNLGAVQERLVFGLAGGAIGGALLFASGGWGLAALGGLAGSTLGLAGAQLRSAERDRTRLRAEMEDLRAQFVYLHQRQGQSEQRLEEALRHGANGGAMSPVATAQDLDVLGSLVRDLAKTVAEHDEHVRTQSEKLKALAAAPKVVVAKIEDDAEIGFTADAPVLPSEPEVAPEVIAELKSSLSSALAANRLDLSLQAVVRLPERAAVGYEAAPTLPGAANALDSAMLRKVAITTGLDGELGLLALTRALQVLRVLRSRGRAAEMVIPVGMGAIMHARFRSTLEECHRTDEELAKLLVIEISDADFRASGSAGLTALNSLKRIGARLALNLGTSLRFHVTELAALGVQRLHVQAETLLNALHGRATASDIHPADLPELLTRHDLILMVSGVRDESMVRELLDLQAPYALGPVFGSPRVVRPEVLQPKPVDGSPQPRTADAATVRPATVRPATGSPAAEAQSQPQRMRLRSFLRKA
jgi:cyclic-di-GMP phosphodiesterase, flagellum assembly factor TipF